MSPDHQVKPNDHKNSDAEDEPFKPSTNGLLVTRGFINGIPASILIDPEADINHISSEFCAKACIHTTAARYKVQLANKTIEEMNVTTDKVILSLGSYSESFRISVCTLNYDVILGKKVVFKA